MIYTALVEIRVVPISHATWNLIWKRLEVKLIFNDDDMGMILVKPDFLWIISVVCPKEYISTTI